MNVFELTNLPFLVQLLSANFFFTSINRPQGHSDSFKGTYIYLSFIGTSILTASHFIAAIFAVIFIIASPLLWNAFPISTSKKYRTVAFMKTLKKLKGDSVNEHACSILVMISIPYMNETGPKVKIAFARRNIIGSVFYFSLP